MTAVCAGLIAISIHAWVFEKVEWYKLFQTPMLFTVLELRFTICSKRKRLLEFKQIVDPKS
jgi:hypothetical protein